ncbi:MAG: SDR family oxidoreductase [Roseburia sp.]|nr:SDR family oxidoreductase [Anaeroplasma bactoclasticum]MCM1196920.1 SDR family oxidoreductase [Roseburia sp.]MCM1556446.1 SDR family oxidoreductase [Anaeroplasma bactoclasticum]
MKVIVTGSSSGIGFEIAKLFLEKGHQVIGFDRKQKTILHSNYTHVQTDIFQGELPDIKDCEILINNAGIQNGNDIDVNLKGTMRITEKYAFQAKIKSVLFIASASAQTGAEFPEYVASKGGMVAYMKNVAMRLAEYFATSNSLSPGGVVTDLNEHILKSPELYEKVLKETLLNRWASAKEIAQWAYFVTVINQSMTAQDILIDNGEAAKFNFIW